MINDQHAVVLGAGPCPRLRLVACCVNDPSSTPLLKSGSAEVVARLAEYGVPTQDTNWLSMPRRELRDAGSNTRALTRTVSRNDDLGPSASPPWSTIDAAASTEYCMPATLFPIHRGLHRAHSPLQPRCAVGHRLMHSTGHASLSTPSAGRRN